jgi:hypothetical protein
LEDRPVDNEYTPWKNFSDVDGEESSGGWGHIVRSLEERYGQVAPRIAGDIRRPLQTDPSMMSALDNVINSPSVDDTPLWRVSCKVPLPHH